MYDSLTDVDKRLVTPGKSEYRDYADSLAARSVKYVDGDPVGFADIYGPYKTRSLFYSSRPKYVVNVAVKDGFRGRGIAKEVVLDSVKKVVDKIMENREDAKSRGLEVRNEPDEIWWQFVRGNDSSERAASNAGFRRSRRGLYTLGIQDAIRMQKKASLGDVYNAMLRSMTNGSPYFVAPFKNGTNETRDPSDLNSEYKRNLIAAPIGVAAGLAAVNHAAAANAAKAVVKTVRPRSPLYVAKKFIKTPGQALKDPNAIFNAAHLSEVLYGLSGPTVRYLWPATKAVGGIAKDTAVLATDNVGHVASGSWDIFKEISDAKNDAVRLADEAMARESVEKSVQDAGPRAVAAAESLIVDKANKKIDDLYYGLKSRIGFYPNQLAESISRYGDYAERARRGVEVANRSVDAFERLRNGLASDYEGYLKRVGGRLDDLSSRWKDALKRKVDEGAGIASGAVGDAVAGVGAVVKDPLGTAVSKGAGRIRKRIWNAHGVPASARYGMEISDYAPVIKIPLNMADNIYNNINNRGMNAVLSVPLGVVEGLPWGKRMENKVIDWLGRPTGEGRIE